jgi:hypothetical protein
MKVKENYSSEENNQAEEQYLKKLADNACIPRNLMITQAQMA